MNFFQENESGKLTIKFQENDIILCENLHTHLLE